ncbi:MAG: type VI secretion system tip protein TssI/VgrG [Campylobacterota bacterium]|nr:type VI secretion system tip protein TssI/VgrG [Campylobacterota bacterium]
MSKEKLFSFKADDYKLEVVSFKGTQAISELYRYEIELISKDTKIDFDKVLQAEVCLTLHDKDNEDTYIHGVLENFEVYQKVDEYVYYRAMLVPKLWWLSIAHHQQIFLKKNVPDILEEVLRESHFTSSDYEFRLQGSYDKREYICQYKESRYVFMKRWMQRDGLYFYFEQSEDGCKVIITDAKEKQKKASVSEKLYYRPTTGLQSYTDQAVSSVLYRSNNTIKSVHMKNFNYEKPSLDISSVKNSKGDDYTQTYMFGHNVLTQDEAKKLTKINEEKFRTQAKEMLGESNVISLTAGYIYSLKDYFRDDLNDDYLMLRVDSEGSQRGFLTAGFTKDGDDSSYYTNSFTMIPSQTQFRDQKTSIWPHISGMLSAIIDGAGSGDTAELDKHGRYKVIMPFDISGKKDAKASAYLRMAQPSAGEKQGMHFPLHKGTEVLIAFKGGDPDQPIIMGAVPNINSPSPVNEDNVTKSVIQTHGGNIIHMEDTPGKAHIKMAVHDDLSSVTIHNDDQDDPDAHWGVAVKTVNGCQLVSAEFENTVLGNKEEFTLGAKEDIMIGAVFELDGAAKASITLGAVFDLIRGKEKKITPESAKLTEKIQNISVVHNHITENHNNTTVKHTHVTENNVEISEEMIAEYVKNIVNGMNLTENYVTKSEVAESVKKLNTSITTVVDNETKAAENLLEKIQNSFKSVQVEINKVEDILSKSKFTSDSTLLRKTASEMSEVTNELTIYQ